MKLPVVIALNVEAGLSMTKKRKYADVLTVTGKKSQIYLERMSK